MGRGQLKERGEGEEVVAPPLFGFVWEPMFDFSFRREAGIRPGIIEGRPNGAPFKVCALTARLVGHQRGRDVARWTGQPGAVDLGVGDGDGLGGRQLDAVEEPMTISPIFWLISSLGRQEHRDRR